MTKTKTKTISSTRTTPCFLAYSRYVPFSCRRREPEPGRGSAVAPSTNPHPPRPPPSLAFLRHRWLGGGREPCRSQTSPGGGRGSLPRRRRCCCPGRFGGRIWVVTAVLLVRRPHTARKQEQEGGPGKKGRERILLDVWCAVRRGAAWFGAKSARINDDGGWLARSCWRTINSNTVPAR